MLVAAMIMSVSGSDDCFSDLLCPEDSGDVSCFSDTGESELPECSSGVENNLPPSDETIAGLIKDESKYVVGVDYLERFQSHSLDLFAREDSIAWILKAQQFYGFQPLTAYLSVNYLDRFLYSRPLTQTNGWPLQLLSVACLSLAAKMEEPLVPSLSDLQVVEGAKFIFETKTILRMELLVLSELDWKLRSITPFDFLTFFGFKVDSTGAYIGILTSRATQILISIMQEASFLEYKPSCIAAAAILCAANEFPNFSFMDAQCAQKWSDGLHKDKINCCYGLMQQIGITKPGEGPKVISQLRVTTRTSRALFNDWCSSTSTTMSSSTLGCCYKRRKLWTNDDKETSD